MCHSQQDALSPLQQLAARRVDEDAVLLQGGTSCLGQAAGPGAAAVAADAIAVPAGKSGNKWFRFIHEDVDSFCNSFFKI